MRRTVPYLILTGLSLLILSGFRAWMYLERSADLSELSPSSQVHMFWIGARLDASLLGLLLLPLALIALAVPNSWLARLQHIVRVYGLLLFLFLFTTEVCAVYFFRYYDFRPNYLVLDHGSDPEVLSTVLRGYPLAWIATVVLGLSSATWMLFRWLCRERKGSSLASGWRDRAFMFLLLCATALAIRGTLDHRPLNPSFAAFSSHRLANEIAGNGTFNVLSEWYLRLKGKYKTVASVIEPLPAREAGQRVRRLAAATGRLADDPHNPLLREIVHPENPRAQNVVLVVLESFTARLIGSLGGQPAISPEFDQLSEEGVLLENCYATGERTIQGLEATISSFPPLPGVGVVRRPQALRDFSTLASVLRDQRRYETLFFYGGQGMFDRMRGFFLQNGYQRFIEERDFEEYDFKGSWGVSDEDVYAAADREFRDLHARGESFFATILTVSLHSPWEYPEGRIEPLPTNIPRPDGFDYEELNTFLYADHALGEFVRRARTAEYFQNTVFVIVGDHGVHLRGKRLVPLDEYRVAALIYAPGRLPARRITQPVSQIDIAPTIMGLLGGAYTSTFFGRDLLDDEVRPGLVPMIYKKERFAAIRGSQAVILGHSSKLISLARGVGLGWKTCGVTTAHEQLLLDLKATVGIAEQLLMTGEYNTGPPQVTDISPRDH